VIAAEMTSSEDWAPGSAVQEPSESDGGVPGSDLLLAQVISWALLEYQMLIGP